MYINIGSHALGEQGLPSHERNNIALVDGFSTSVRCVGSQVITDLFKKPVRGLHDVFQSLFTNLRFAIARRPCKCCCELLHYDCWKRWAWNPVFGYLDLPFLCGFGL